MVVDMTGFNSKRDAAADKLQEPVANSFEEYCKTLHPLWNTHISRTYAEQFFRAGQSAQPAQLKRGPIGFDETRLISQLNNAYLTGHHDGKKSAQPAQEPVGQVGAIGSDGFVGHIYDDRKVKTGDKLYTTPPKRKWVELKPEEINAVDKGFTSSSSFYAGALWAQAKLKEKNNG